jgi:hypothetical protein
LPSQFGGGIWFDSSDQLFKMWYMGGYTQHLCLTTSTDGIHWTRPELDVVNGTNIVLRRGAPESNSLLMDLNESDPAKRFKYVYFQPVGSLGLVVGDHLYFYVSARQGDPELTDATEWIHDANVTSGLAVMRRDGFASTGTIDESKTLTTRQLRFNRKHLFVNVDAPESELQAEALGSDRLAASVDRGVAAAQRGQSP